MVSEKQKWREKSEGTLENILYAHGKRKLKLKDWYLVFWAIGAALISISYGDDNERN